MADNKLTLSEIRDEVQRRAAQVVNLKKRLAVLGKEIDELLDEIDEMEGGGAKGRRRRLPTEAYESDDLPPPTHRGRKPATYEDGQPRRRGRPRKKGAKRKKAPPRIGPSVVDVAVEILKEEGRPLAANELAEKVESRGVKSGNTPRVILMSAGRKKSRLKKTPDGTIALTETAQ
ncbi:MAG: HTH domain-containing protein [Planctomycetota bacterium]|jgi:hypothetical protein